MSMLLSGLKEGNKVCTFLSFLEPSENHFGSRHILTSKSKYLSNSQKLKKDVLYLLRVLKINLEMLLAPNDSRVFVGSRICKAIYSS